MLATACQRIACINLLAPFFFLRTAELLAAQRGVSLVLGCGAGLLTAPAENTWRLGTEATAALVQDVALWRLPFAGRTKVGPGIERGSDGLS